MNSALLPSLLNRFKVFWEKQFLLLESILAAGIRPTLGGGVEVARLGIAQEVVFVVGEAAEEEGTADQDNRGRPPKAIGPVIDVIDSGVEMKGESLGVPHGVDYQGDDLEHS